jgi:putative aminopeptidase FrvX
MNPEDLHLIHELCQIPSPSGNEGPMKKFLLDYVNQNQEQWSVQPTIIHGTQFQDCLILKFGNPRTAVFAHIDTIGFTVRYENQLVPIGSPEAEEGFRLVGKDSMGPIECKLKTNGNGSIFYDFGRGIQTGTELTFACNFRETEDFIESSYLDNRLGIFNCLKLAETIENGLLIFTCGEEHGGGTVPFLVKYIYENWEIRQALISDITWVSDGVDHGKGVVISMRDMSVPRQSFVKKIIDFASTSEIDYQLEVERGGGSDGREIQASPYPIDWCFIGAPIGHMHSPDERVHKGDIKSMLTLYQFLLENL